MKRLAILAACLAVGAVHAQKACSPADMQKAEKAVDQVVTWAHLQKAWRDWRHCDTGSVADIYTDAILRLMVEWKSVEVLAEGMKDPEYASFIRSHLQSPAAKDDLKDVRSRATQSCPKGQDAVCKQISAATEGEKPIDLSPMAPVAGPATK